LPQHERTRWVHAPFNGLLLAALVLGVAVTATTENSGDNGSVVASPSPVASASRTVERKAPTAKPRRTKEPVPKKPVVRESMTPSTPPTPFRKSSKPPARPRGIVYLTFDDGPSPYTPAILDVLRATRSTATFFEVGFRQAEHPATPAHVRARGSNIGNHTYSHWDLTTLTSAEIRSQVARGPRSKCVRPPFGATNPRVRRVLTQQGLRQVLWTADTLDWKRPGVMHIVKAATGPNVRAGSIVLMHDGGGDRSQTVAALPGIIATLHQRGYVVRRIPGC
jgi:peptidoglycan-N-acetylglucosamine deacetylase